jgi:acyl-CoA thioesterase YciA
VTDGADPRTGPGEPWLALQVVMMPRDANPIPYGALPGFGTLPLYPTIFGGVILSNIDLAGSIAARREVLRRGGVDAAFVTVAINRVEFKQPVLVGDTVRFVARVLRVGRTSATMHVDVWAERGADSIHVTEAEVVYVGVDAGVPPPDRRPVPLFPPAGPAAPG